MEKRSSFSRRGKECFCGHLLCDEAGAFFMPLQRAFGNFCQAVFGVLQAERLRSFLICTKAGSLCPPPMAVQLLYRLVQHDGEKRFDDQPRVLTYRGATYQTRVFDVRYEALKAS